MKVLVTGSKGFIGRNLVAELEARNYEILSYDKSNKVEDLDQLLFGVDYIFHLAGSNRPTNPDDYYNINHDLTQALIDALKRTKSKAPIIYSSSIHALLDNDYGKSKLCNGIVNL